MYLCHVIEDGEIHDKVIDLLVKDSNLREGEGAVSVWVGRVDHSPLTSTKHPIHSHLHIQHKSEHHSIV